MLPFTTSSSESKELSAGNITAIPPAQLGKTKHLFTCVETAEPGSFVSRSFATQFLAGSQIKDKPLVCLLCHFSDQLELTNGPAHLSSQGNWYPLKYKPEPTYEAPWLFAVATHTHLQLADKPLSLQGAKNLTYKESRFYCMSYIRYHGKNMKKKILNVTK